MNPVKAIIVCAPSCGGKGTAVEYILGKYPDQFTSSVSVTTRKQGSNEIHGKDYYFITPEDFKERLANGEILEHEEVYTNKFYGTLRSELARAEQEGKTIIFEVDMRGAKSIKEKLGDQVKCLFVDAGENIQFYETRIRERARSSDTEEDIQERIAKVPQELAEGRELADDIIPNQGTREQYKENVEDCLTRNHLVGSVDEKTREIKSFKIH